MSQHDDPDPLLSALGHSHPQKRDPLLWTVLVVALAALVAVGLLAYVVTGREDKTITTTQARGVAVCPFLDLTGRQQLDDTDLRTLATDPSISAQVRDVLRRVVADLEVTPAEQTELSRARAAYGCVGGGMSAPPASPTVTVRPTVTAPATSRTGSAARPGPAITPTPASRVGTRPALTPSPTATTTTTPGPSPSPTFPASVCLLGVIRIGSCP